MNLLISAVLLRYLSAAADTFTQML